MSSIDSRNYMIWLKEYLKALADGRAVRLLDSRKDLNFLGQSS